MLAPITEDLTDAEIATRRCISEQTVEAHVRRISPCSPGLRANRQAEDGVLMFHANALWRWRRVTVAESGCPKILHSQRPWSNANTAVVRVTRDHAAILQSLFLVFRAVETRGIEPLTPALQSF